MNANERQVGGAHYRETKIQHWDYAAANNFDYFQGQITKYVTRWREKNGIEDLEKARHFLDKYIEVERSKPKAVPIRRGIEGIRRIDQKPFGYDHKEETGEGI